ncbi:MAG: choice-of-anchor D domain-containing protein [Solirubrobacterales bacterium]|nr:choice-of-anchor D domain-containing protein [Solirubrobacterales bacterium]
MISVGSVGDVNGDGWPDVVAGMTRRTFMVALGSSTGQFTDAPGSPFLVPPSIVNPSGSFTTSAIGDFDGDGNPDVALGLDDNTNSAPAVFTAEGDGTGAFTSTGTPARLLDQYQWPSSLRAIDLNGDAYDDLAVDVPNANSVFTSVGSATGLVDNPAAGGTVPLPGDYPYALAVGDLNLDGWQDLAIANRGGSRSVATMASDGTGSLSAFEGSPFPLPKVNGKDFAANTLTTGDFNGDGAPDLASTSTHGGDTNQARGIDVLINQPDVGVSPASLDFPTTRINQTSAQQVVTVKNTGGPSVLVSSVTKSGTNPDQFNVESNDCLSLLGSGEECSIAVTFSPTSYPTPTASLDIDVSGVGTTSVYLTGHTPPYMDFVPPDGLEFGEVTSGYAPAAKTETVVIYSGGGAPLQLGAPQLTGPDAADFSIDDPTACLNPIEFGNHCSLDITFSPAADTGGLREASLTFLSNNDPDFDQEIPLSGYARRAEFTVQPSPFDFGEAKIGSSIGRASQTFTLTSSGPAQVPFTGAALNGPDADSFVIKSNDCTPMIPANTGTCSISVAFDPKSGSAGTRTASLDIDAFSSTHPGPTQVALTGKAITDPIPPPPETKPKLTLKLKSARKVKRGKVLVLTATVGNVGNGAAKPLVIRATAPARLARSPRAIKVANLAPGRQVTRKLRIKTKRFKGKRPKNLKVKVTAASGSVKRAATKRVKLR